jgi:hypothetical protein
VWYEPIDDWLDHGWQGELDPILDYARTVDIYVRHFGRESVHVLLHEQMARDTPAFVAGVCRIAGIDEQEGVRRTALHVENSASGRLVERVRRASALPMGFLLAKLAATLEVRRLLGGATDDSATPTLREPSRRRIAERTRDGNRRLGEEFGLDLARYGYPL